MTTTPDPVGRGFADASGLSQPGAPARTRPTALRVVAEALAAAFTPEQFTFSTPLDYADRVLSRLRSEGYVIVGPGGPGQRVEFDAEEEA